MNHCSLRGSSTLALALVIGAISLASAYSSGPLNGKTGAPGEGNCTDCHNSFALDSGPGDFGLTIGQPQYSPDSEYTVLIEISDPAAMRWGFELTFINSGGLAAGTLTSLDGDTQVNSQDGRDYGKHTSQGSHPGQPVSQTWMMNWTAPPEGSGEVRLYAMGNAANNNGTNQGDYIYSFMATLNEGPTTGTEAAMHFASLGFNYPNPFNPRTAIPFSLERETWVRLSIFDARGRLVTVLEDGPLAAGQHERSWSGKDGSGQSQPSGIYLARLTDGQGDELAPSRKMILGK